MNPHGIDGFSEVWHGHPMPKRSRKATTDDLNQLAASIVAQAVGGHPVPSVEGKNPAAIALGRLGGLKGGRARANSLSKARRSQIAKKAAAARWKAKKTA